jgi:hypothetical protein
MLLLLGMFILHVRVHTQGEGLTIWTTRGSQYMQWYTTKVATVLS